MDKKPAFFEKRLFRGDYRGEGEGLYFDGYAVTIKGVKNQKEQRKSCHFQHLQFLKIFRRFDERQ